MVPIVIAAGCVIFELKAVLFEQSGKLVVCSEQAFLLAAGEKEVGHFSRVGEFREQKGIVVALRLPLPRPKDGAKTPPLWNSF